MTIKSDRWIQVMAREYGMIEPFVAEQVRGGIISYGLSSYGYDMRVADEFKVFTNVFNTLVDPKHFDPRSFVDVRGDYCDIPPTLSPWRVRSNIFAFRAMCSASCSERAPSPAAALL